MDEIQEEHKPVIDKDKLTAAIIVGSLLTGVVGGSLGARMFSPGISGERTIVLKEDSAVVDVVDQTKDSIVSVVGTKLVAMQDLSRDFFFGFCFNLPPRSNRSQEERISAGTGFFLTEDVLLATNKHVVSDTAAKYSVFTNDGKQHAAE